MATSKIRYCSTRGASIERNQPFEKILFSAYATDGGLYVPECIPKIKSVDLKRMAAKKATLAEVTAFVMEMYTSIPAADCLDMCEAAFKTFNDGKSPSLPLLKVKDNYPYFLETGNGPTLAFKDIGQQVVAQLLNYYLGKRKKRANIIVETSGDTGPAAIAAVKDLKNINIFCLYPNERVSVVQELQLTTVDSDNVEVFRTEGNTDEQAEALKILFMDSQFMEKYSVCSINSINFARIMAQSCYYFWSYIQLQPLCEKKVTFIVPSGAFGNACGGYLAKLMNLPIDKIICATNANDIVHRTLSTGDMFMGANKKTVSPAMDIQFAYNLERMLYFMLNQNSDEVSFYMKQLEQNNSNNGPTKRRGCQLDELLVLKIQETFTSLNVTDESTMDVMKKVDEASSYHLCPHSAIGVFAYFKLNNDNKDNINNNKIKNKLDHNNTVCVLTAHPAKFDETLIQAGLTPRVNKTVQHLRSLPNDKFNWLRANKKKSKEKILEWSKIVKKAVEVKNANAEVVTKNEITTITNNNGNAVTKSPFTLGLDTIKRVVKEKFLTLIEAQVNGFISFSQGLVEVAPVQHLDLGSYGDVCVKSGFIKNGDKFVVKCAGGFPGNVALNKSTSTGLMLVFNQKSGNTDSILFDNGYLTDVRTAIAGAIAARKLAKINAKQGLEKIGIVGTGMQARFQLRWLKVVGIIAPVVVWGRNIEKANIFKSEMINEGFDVAVATEMNDLTRECNLIVTTTSAKKPILHSVRPGTHITAIGSDGIGKRELSEDLVKQADVKVADSKKQCLAFGELSCCSDNDDNHPVVELGELLLQGSSEDNIRSGKNDDRITLFDSTGVAIQDVMIACGVLEAAMS